MNRFARAAVAAAVAAAGGVIGFLLGRPAAEPPPPGPPPAPAPGRHALLVGVTRYDHLPGRDLDGPGRDAALLREVLVGRLGFPPAAVVTLAEGAGLRPTRANVEQAFADLAGRVGPGDRVVVLLAGHGARQPEPDPPDPDGPEPDGIDEVFLPADAMPWDGRRIPNAVVDTDVGRWLKRLTDRGAEVLAVFDCCHAGNVRRAAGAGTAREREAALAPDEVLAAARSRAARRGPPVRGFARPDPRLVALYACRADEPTVEDRLPAGAADAEYHGLFTYTLCGELARAAAPPTYRELVRRVRAAYASRPVSSPTPGAEGLDLDREVLGDARWPDRPAVGVRRVGAGYALAAGELHGVTPGSVLAVTLPGGGVAGHLRVTAAGPLTARGEPHEWQGRPNPAGFPDGSAGRVVFTDYGPRRLRVGVLLPPGPDRAEVDAALARLARLDDPVERAADPRLADWVVRAAGGRLVLADAAGGVGPFPMPAASAAEFPATLWRKLEAVARARALLAVAARVGADAGAGLRAEVLCDPAGGGPTEALAAAAEVREGNRIAFRVRNTGAGRVDVTVLTVGADSEIARYFPPVGEDPSGGKWTLDPGAELVTQSQGLVPPFGAEYAVVLATPAAGPPADFGCLAQDGISRGRSADRGRALDGPFGSLLSSAVFRSRGPRGLTSDGAAAVGAVVVPFRTRPAD